MVLHIGSIELLGSIYHNNKEAFSIENESFNTKLDNISNKDMYTLLGVSCGPLSQKCPNHDPILAQTLPSHSLSNWFFQSLNQYTQ